MDLRGIDFSGLLQERFVVSLHDAPAPTDVAQGAVLRSIDEQGEMWLLPDQSGAIVVREGSLVVNGAQAIVINSHDRDAGFKAIGLADNSTRVVRVFGKYFGPESEFVLQSADSDE